VASCQPRQETWTSCSCGGPRNCTSSRKPAGTGICVITPELAGLRSRQPEGPGPGTTPAPVSWTGVAMRSLRACGPTTSKMFLEEVAREIVSRA